MNLADFLLMKNGNTIKPGADLFDILLAKKLGGAGVITTLVGNPLSFLAKKAQTAQSTKVTLSPVQEGSGDPSPTNIRPISGRSSVEINGCGKNMFDIDVLNISPITVTNGVATGTAANFNATFGMDANPIYENTKDSVVSISLEIKTDGNQSTSGNGLIIRFKYTDDTDKTIITVPNSTVNFTRFTGSSDPRKNLKEIHITYSSSGQNVWYIQKVQIELGSSATEYEQFAESNDVTITFPALGKNLFYYDESKASVCETSTETVRSYYPTGITNCTITFSAYLIDSESVTNTFINIGKLVDGKLYVLGSFLSTNGSITNRTVTFADGEEAVLMSAVSETSGITLNLPKYNIQCELGSSASAYEPYTNTVYSGTLDVETGVLTMDKKGVKISDLSISRSNNGGNWPHYLFYANLSDRKRASTGICDVYKFITSTEAQVLDDCFILPSCNTYMYIRDDSIDNVADFMTNRGDYHIVYELATPRTIQLTPEQIQILKGQNNIWIEDEGAVMELSYMD